MSRTLWLALFVALGGVAAWIAVAGPRADATAVVPMTLDGQALPPGDADAALAAARDVARAWLGKSLSIDVEGVAAQRTREQIGARVDWEHLRSLVAEVRDPRSPLQREQAQRAPGRTLALAVPYALDPQAALTQLLQLKDEVDRDPVDAHYDFKTKALSSDQPGRSLDVWATLARIDGALARSETTLAAVVAAAPARRTVAQLAGVSTEAVMGWFETKYARDLKHEARSFNLRLAASKFDGYVLLPHETFDFNQVVGPRTEANGYKVAPVIAQGELVDGIGGGTCQVAGTLHAAAFFGGLDIEERKPHTRPSFYIKMGLDAAVAYPTVTLRLGNPYAFPVVLHETVEGGLVRAEVLGPKLTRDVMFARRIDDVVPFAEKDAPDPNLPKGARELKQRGIPGFKVTRWRVVRDGPFAVREHHQDYYPPTTQIWRVGKGPTDANFEAHDDEHPEYVADEFLSIAQGPDVAKKAHATAAGEAGPPRGDMVESRVPGRTGTYGWTVREGFAKDIHGTRAKEGSTETREGID
ncbi:MAG: VanW family protein [Polyangiaceae bacterium]